MVTLDSFVKWVSATCDLQVGQQFGNPIIAGSRRTMRWLILLKGLSTVPGNPADFPLERGFTQLC